MTRKRLLLGALAVSASSLVAIAIFALVDGGGGGKAGTAERLSGSQALLFGRVTDSRSRAPLAGAEIKIDQPGGEKTVRTDAKGTYHAVVDTSRSIGMTVDAPGHRGAVAFVKLCAGERRDLPMMLSPADQAQAPPAPVVVGPRCR